MMVGLSLNQSYWKLRLARVGLVTLPLIGFGGGCHWCTEAVFDSLVGVHHLSQGFIRSTPPNDSLSEAVQFEFDPNQISLTVLIEVHLRTHSSMSNHSLREKYRSAVYTSNERVRDNAKDIIQTLQADFEKPLITQVLPLVEFQASPDQYQQYYQKHFEGAFCQRFVDPKLTMIRREFSAQVITA